jgi:hypothetical protein
MRQETSAALAVALLVASGIHDGLEARETPTALLCHASRDPCAAPLPSFDFADEPERERPVLSFHQSLTAMWIAETAWVPHSSDRVPPHYDAMGPHLARTLIAAIIGA